MTPRENALEIIRFGKPEYIMPEPPRHPISYLGYYHEGFDGGRDDSPLGSKWIDIWGTGWNVELEGVMGFPRSYPLEDLVGSLRSFHWPDPNDERIIGPVFERMKGWKKEETFLTGLHRDTLWERAYMLIGMENAMCYFYSEPNAMREVLHRVMDFHLGMAKHYLDLGVEMVCLDSDLGMQTGPLLSPALVEEFLVPEFRRICDLYRDKGVLIHFHSCGSVVPFLEMLIKLGVNILNPVQTSANDLDEVRRITNGKVALHGGVSSNTLMNGPMQKIRDEVSNRMWQLGRKGGYFCCEDQTLPWPKENERCMRSAIAEFGRYPIRSSAHSFR